MTEARPYALSLASSVEPFRPEILHVLTCLERWYGLVRMPSAARVLHYGDAPPPGAVHVPAILFPGGVALAPDGIRLARTRFAALEDALVPPAYKQRNGRIFSYDVIGLAFLLLARLEERDAPLKDRYARFPHSEALTVRRTGGAPPWADEALDALAGALLETERPTSATDYRLMPTHDVDMLRSYHRWWEPLRYAAGDALKRGRPGRALRRLSDSYTTNEPWRSVEYLMAASETRGLTSRFYMMGPSRHSMDSPYAAIDAALMRRVTDRIAARGHILGFHPGFMTATDGTEWQRQHHGLEAIAGQPVREGRQHVLRYDATLTPEIWAEAGMVCDVTLAWPEVTGFRSGSCRSHPAYSLRARRTLALEQISTAVMEFGLFGGKYRSLSIEAALDDCRPALAACRRFGGNFVVLMHTHQRRPPETVFYEHLLDLAA
ncbi:MAG: hypothetical protein NTY59_00360 [Alphaproteobacteria bacterium]|nr:hypothetical protein [Alphaproteobacteria bacterium]